MNKEQTLDLAAKQDELAKRKFIADLYFTLFNADLTTVHITTNDSSGNLRQFDLESIVDFARFHLFIEDLANRAQSRALILQHEFEEQVLAYSQPSHTTETE